MEHRFLLLNRDASPPERFNEHHRSPAALVLHDDLVWYLDDFFSWVPTECPHKSNSEGVGLTEYGPTIISPRGAGKLRDVCRGLAAVFAQGPSTLELRGLYTPARRGAGDGGYAKVRTARDELVNKLLTLADWAEAVTVTPQVYILHLGL